MCQVRAGLEHHDYGIIPFNWLLLDTYSTSTVGKDSDIFMNIWEGLEEERLTVVTNCGNKAFNKIGDNELFPIEAHFNLHSMANIVALKDMANVTGSRITMDGSKEREITVEYQGKFYNSKEFQDGLYYYDTAVDCFRCPMYA